VNVEIWSDLVCPWCYLGKRRFEHALAKFEQRDRVSVIWRSYQLDPSAPAETPGTLNEMLTKKYGFGLRQAQAAHERLAGLGKADGIAYDFDGARHGNTKDAHRLIHLARSVGKDDAMNDRLMKGYFEQRMPIGKRDALRAAAVELGLDGGEVDDMFSSDRFDAEVRAEQDAARKLGISGVPAFVIDGAVAVSGAQSEDTFLIALQRAWDSTPDSIKNYKGEVCEPGKAHC
jgi:predicted DsbA family dithiol-disulfide isomerase